MPMLALAMCGWVHWLGHPAGAPLPPQGSLYYDDEHSGDEGAPVFHFEDGKGELSIVDLGDHVSRIDYKAEPDARLVYGKTEAVSYPVIDKVRREEPRVLQYWHWEQEWTCSSADALVIQLDQPIAAVRVAWTRGMVTEHHVVVPRTSGHKVMLQLGQINCGNEANVDPEELRLGGHLELVGIRLDGSEVVIPGLPDEISTDDMASYGTWWGPAIDTPLPPRLDDDPPPPPVVKPQPKPEPSDTTGAIVLLIVAATILAGWRFGLRQPVQPRS